jgi:hypothetical protein
MSLRLVKKNKSPREPSATKADLENQIDALFKLPLAEFTDARNALAAQLKKSGSLKESVLVKALAKPPISAWAVNQLYWNHRQAFDRLIASGERFHKAQTSRNAGKVADMRDALDGRREALMDLEDRATSLLRSAGHNPTLDIIRRLTATLEAISVYESGSDAPRPGRLTHDVDPPGFGSFGSFVPVPVITVRTKEPARTKPAPKPSHIAVTAQKATPHEGVREREEIRKKKIAAAKVSLQAAKKSLTAARGRVQNLEAEQKKADVEAKKSAKQKRDAEEKLEKAKAASEVAAERVRSVAEDLEAAATLVDEAERKVEKASKELEALTR